MNLYKIFKRISALICLPWKAMALTIICSLTGGLLSAGLMGVLHTLLKDRSSISTYAWFFAILALAVPMVRIVSRILSTRLAQGVTFDLQANLANRISATRLHDLEQLGAPRLLAILTQDVQTIADVFNVVPHLCMQLTIILGCIGYMGFLSWQVLTLLLIVIFLGLYFYFQLRKWMLRITRLVRDEQDSLFKHFRTLTEGIKELKLHFWRRKAFFLDIFHPTIASLKHHNIASNSIFALIGNLGTLLFFGLLGLIIFALPALTDIDVYVLSGYVLIILYIQGPLTKIPQAYMKLERSRISLTKIEEALRCSSHADSTTDWSLKPDPHISWSRLEMVNITHLYGDVQSSDHFALGPINLVFRPGEIVYLVGGNGSGKTTLAKLLTGLYTPENGKIFLDNQPVTSGNRESYRQLFSAVFSDFYLFDSVVGMKCDSQCDAHIQGYLSKLHIDHKVQVRNGIFSTTSLSQGQRKRLALLITYLEDRPFLVFDEWAADQDPIFKQLFYKQLLPELKHQGKTILAICHDDRYYHLADRIVKLNYEQVEYDRPQIHPEEAEPEMAVPI